MSDETTPPEADLESTPESTPEVAPATARTGFMPDNQLQKESDRPSRPGFRDPPNNKTKAHNKKKRK